jgi:beta-glucanase (GH16 family)
MHPTMSPARSVLLLSALCACAPNGAGGDGGADAAGDAPGGFSFDDEMNGSALDDSAWIAVERPGDSSLGELECYRAARVSESSGSLVLSSLVDPACSPLLYGSGMVQWKTFAFLYGTIEIRARAPGGKGPWWSLRLLGAECQAQNPTTAGCAADEIVLAENRSSDHTTVWQTVRSGATTLSCSATVTDTSQSFHTYRLAWSNAGLTWQIDGVTSCTQASAIPTKPMFLVMDTAMGGAGGGIDPGTLPQQHLVDYVRVWQ